VTILREQRCLLNLNVWQGSTFLCIKLVFFLLSLLMKFFRIEQPCVERLVLLEGPERQYFFRRWS
jgi:hypothetical protein